MSVNLRALIGKLNAATRGAVEGAAGLCLSRTHYDVEIEHFLVKAARRDGRRPCADPQALRREPFAPGR